MSEPTLEQATVIVDEALRGTRLWPAWLVVRTAARRNRRLRETLPRVFELGQHVVLALERLERLIPKLSPDARDLAAQIRDHLLAMRDAVQTRREDEETQPFRID